MTSGTRSLSLSIRLEAIATRASRLKAIALRLDAVSIGLSLALSNLHSGGLLDSVTQVLWRRQFMSVDMAALLDVGSSQSLRQTISSLSMH